MKKEPGRQKLPLTGINAFEPLVENDGVDFLNPSRGLTGHDNLVITGLLGFATVLSGQQDGFYPQFLCLLEGGEHVRAVAARAEADEDVAWFAECPNLTCKDLIVTIVVGDTSERRDVRVEANGREWRTINEITSNQFLRQMEGIGGASAIAAAEQLVAISEAGNDRAARQGNAILKTFASGEHGLKLYNGVGERGWRGQSLG